MRIICQIITLVFLAGCVATGSYEAPKDEYQERGYTRDAFGLGIHRDQYNRPFTWQHQDGTTINPYNKVIPNYYGPGTGIDQYGRPVEARPYP